MTFTQRLLDVMDLVRYYHTYGHTLREEAGERTLFYAIRDCAVEDLW